MRCSIWNETDFHPTTPNHAMATELSEYETEHPSLKETKNTYSQSRKLKEFQLYTMLWQ